MVSYQKNVRMWFNFHKSKHRYYNVKLLQYELFWMNLTRLSCQKRIKFGKLYSRGLVVKRKRKKEINVEWHIQPCTQIRLRTDRLLIRIMTMHTCAAHCVIFRPMKVLSVCMFDESGWDNSMCMFRAIVTTRPFSLPCK